MDIYPTFPANKGWDHGHWDHQIQNWKFFEYDTSSINQYDVDQFSIKLILLHPEDQGATMNMIYNNFPDPLKVGGAARIISQ